MAKRPPTVLSTPSTNRPPQNAVSNRLLAALPPDDFARVHPLLDVVPLNVKEILHKPGEVMGHAYFPEDGFCSVLTVLEDGDMVEVATVGREGMIGMPEVLNRMSSLSATMVQADIAACYRMRADDFRTEMNRHGAFYELLTRYGQAYMGFVMQSTACNAVHSVEQRLARWLLLAHDRVGRDKFQLTQEFLAMMLGAARPTVTVVAGALQRAGLITYRRGEITIVNRAELEEASCECYRVATMMLDRVTSGANSA